jgi:hypothetical protein
MLLILFCYVTSQVLLILDVFAKLQKVTLSSVMSLCPSVCLFVHMEQLGSHWTGFHEILCLMFFENLSRKFKFH